jgi:four helix bundle protein
VSIARGSLAEVETFILLADRLGYVHADDLRPVKDSIAEIGKMLTTLHRRLR